MTELRLLGEIELRATDGAEVHELLRLPKRLALLAYLASPTPGTWHRRDTLLALFWPELDTARARTALRNALYVLRQHLGERAIRARGDEEVSVDRDELRTDVGALWAALGDKRLDDALQLYRGELLPGLHPPESEGFMRWLDAERLRIRTALTSAAKARADELEQRGDLAGALSLTRRIIEIEPDDERTVRRLMSLHDRMGDRAGALATFEAYRKRLSTEFAAEPAPETLALVDQLRDSQRIAPRSVRRRDEGASAEARPRDDEPVSLAPRVQVGASGRRPTMLFAAGGVAIVLVTLAAYAMTRPVPPQRVGAAAPLTSAEELEVEAAISPNGRLIAYTRGTTDRLKIVVRRIDGSEPLPLTPDSSAVEQMPRWSPDNDEILFLSRGHAWVAPSIGGTPRIVARGIAGTDGAIRSASWSPHGDSVAIVRNDSLIILPVRGSGTRYVGRGRQIHACVWAPSGEWIACVSGNWVAYEPGPLFGNRGHSAVVVFPAAGGDPVDLTGSEFQHDAPAWSEDGRFLWMISDREGTHGDVFAMPIGRNGRPYGRPVRVGLTSGSISLSRGRIAYTVPFRRSNVWAIPVPGDAISALASAGKRITSGTQLIEVIEASADGKWLVYDSNLSGNADIFRLPLSGGPSERLVEDPRPDYCGGLSPDGTELAWHRWYGPVRRVLVKRLDGDSASDAFPGVTADQGSPHWSPDGTAIAAWIHEKEEGSVIVTRRDSTGRWRLAWRLQGGQLPAWSRDGRSLAFVRYNGAIETIPADSGARRRVYTPRPGSSDPIATYLYWKLDPSTIWFLADDSTGQGGIWSVSVNGGAPRLRVRLGDSAGRTHGPTLTSDGSKFYVTLEDRFSNVWWAELRDR